MRLLFTWIAILFPAIALGQQQLEWNWNRMHIAIDSSGESDLSARSSEIIQQFYKALTEAENTLGYKASGSLHFEAFNDLNKYELALREHSAYRHLQGLSIEDANDGIFPLYLHATQEEMQQQLRWGIAYSLLREYLFGITVKQRFDQAKLTRLPGWILYGFCRYFAMGWKASDMDEWQYFYDNRAFQNSNHILAQSQDVYGQFVWKEISQNLGTGSLSSIWFVIKYTGQIDAAFQYHLGMDFHQWIAPYLTKVRPQTQSSLFQSDLDWGSGLMGHPLIDIVLDSVPNRGIATFFWPGKQAVAFCDFERSHRWIRIRDQVSLCRDLCFSQTLIWNHKDKKDWESLWKEDDHWVWSRWSERGELVQRDIWEFTGHPLQAFYIESKLYITEQIGDHQQASVFGTNPLPFAMGDWKEIRSVASPGILEFKYHDSIGRSMYSTAEQKKLEGLAAYHIQSMVGESRPYWSIIASQNDQYHWLLGSESAASIHLMGEWPLEGHFPIIGYTGNTQIRFISDYLEGQARVRLFSIKAKPDSLQSLLKPANSHTPISHIEIDQPGAIPSSTVQFLGPFAKPSKPRTQLINREPQFPSMELLPHIRWYYIKHASVKFSNRNSPLLIPVELPLSHLYNSPVTPDFFTQISSSDLRHRLEINALISPDFKRHSLSLSQEYDLKKGLTIGQELQMLRRRVIVEEKNKHWQSWNLELSANRIWTNRSEWGTGICYEHAYVGNLFTTDASLHDPVKEQGMWSVHFDWLRNCGDLPFLRNLDYADFSARLVAAHSPGLSGMGSADFKLNMHKQSGRQLRWNSTISLHYAPGKDAIIYWVGGSQGWTSREAWVNPYTGIFNDRSLWQQMGPGIRGFQSGARLGSSYAVLNQTLSSPILQYLHTGLMHSEFSKSLILFVFNDVGTSFFGLSPQSEGNPFNTQYLSTPNYSLSVTSKRNPYLGSAGIGLQARFLGYYWRLERAWGYQERKVQSPIWHISMGKSIDWN